jgi:hypothetical protein
MMRGRAPATRLHQVHWVRQEALRLGLSEHAGVCFGRVWPQRHMVQRWMECRTRAMVRAVCGLGVRDPCVA